MTRRPALFFAFLFGVTGALLAQPPATTTPAPAPTGSATDTASGVAPYQRTVEQDDGTVLKLEMASREFSPAKPGQPKVYLVGAVHVANESFYKDLQAFLDAQDVVLFEGVKPPGSGSSEHDQGTMTDEQKTEATKRRVRFLAMAVQRYERKQGKLPASLDELTTGSEGRIAQLLKASTNDYWGRPITYTVAQAPATDSAGGDKPHETATPSSDSSARKVARFDVVSLGADGKPGGEGAAADLRFSDQEALSKPELGDRSGGIQQKLADALGAVFQLTAMNSNKPNWRNSDLSLDQVQSRLDAAGANADALFSMLDGSSMMGKFAGMFLSLLSSSEESRAMLRVMMIEMLGHADELMAAKLPGDSRKMMSVLIEDRNAVVIGDLKQIIANEPNVKSIAIIYGAGHLPAMQKVLTGELGYTPVGDTWRTAMTVDAKSAGISARQLQSTRDMVGKMITQASKAKKPKDPEEPAKDN